MQGAQPERQRSDAESGKPARESTDPEPVGAGELELLGNAADELATKSHKKSTLHTIPISIAVFPPGDWHSREWLHSGFVHFGAFLWLSELFFGFGGQRGVPGDRCRIVGDRGQAFNIDTSC